MTLIIIFRIVYEAYFRFPHFKIVKANMRKWIRRNKDVLISYQIELKMKKKSTELVFEDVWIDEKKYNFNLGRSGRKVAGSFDEKEILSLNILSENFEAGNIVPEKCSKGILLVVYTFKNKKKYLSIKKFREMDGLRLIGS